jgi:hypothetical protein
MVDGIGLSSWDHVRSCWLVGYDGKFSSNDLKPDITVVTFVL